MKCFSNVCFAPTTVNSTNEKEKEIGLKEEWRAEREKGRNFHKLINELPLILDNNAKEKKDQTSKASIKGAFCYLSSENEKEKKENQIFFQLLSSHALIKSEKGVNILKRKFEWRKIIKKGREGEITFESMKTYQGTRT